MAGINDEKLRKMQDEMSRSVFPFSVIFIFIFSVLLSGYSLLTVIFLYCVREYNKRFFFLVKISTV